MDFYCTISFRKLTTSQLLLPLPQLPSAVTTLFSDATLFNMNTRSRMMMVMIMMILSDHCVIMLTD
jgi:hypothetical protein